MRIIYNPVTDPHFNLAAEEYLMTASREDVFMLWQNAPSVIIGRYQNAYLELNLDYIAEQGIKVARRITGGGAVFHDLGNVNFSFIVADPTGGINFPKYTRPIVEALGKMGICANADGRNDIVADGRKISGNAECRLSLEGGRAPLLHHGTLLFSADMSALSAALKVREDKLVGKGIRSVSARVANIRDLEGYTGPDTADGFINAIYSQFTDGGTDMAERFTDREIAAISALAEKKFRTWEWNFGRSPEFTVEKTKRFPFGEVSLRLSAEHGTVTDAEVTGDFFSPTGVAELEAAMVGERIDALLTGALGTPVKKPIGEYILGMTDEDLLSLLRS